MGSRVTYRRRLSYNTKSNKVRKVKTPGTTPINIQDPESSSSTPEKEESDQELPMIVAIAERELMVLPSSGPTTTKDFQGDRKPCQDHTAEYFAQDVSRAESSGLSSSRRSRPSRPSRELPRNEFSADRRSYLNL